jgi:hypothetical protein
MSTLLIVAFIDPDNCVFRSASRNGVSVARQTLLLLLTLGLFGTQCIFAPFMEPVNNASEWVSRLSYVATSLLALLVAVGMKNYDIILYM